ncbi:MAG TPA: SDR family oxidoreductase [Alphaproteobacteria bacterium]|nr:SDR family oxidoreductase [Alphaproteobacteria bacterium]
MPASLFADTADKVALITGAGSGIGRAVTRRLKEEGIGRFAITDRNEAGLAETAEMLGLGRDRVLSIVADVTDADGWREAEARIRDRFGRLDLALANAGVTTSGTIVDYPIDDFRRVMAINVDGVFLTLKSALRLIRDGGRGGSVVVVSSVTGIKAQPATAAYGASKAAVLQLAKVAAKEHAADKIRVNAILPGGVETPIWWDQPSFRDLVAKTGSEKGAFDTLAGWTTPLGRYFTPDEMAGQILYLLSDLSVNVTGIGLIADGGYTI